MVKTNVIDYVTRSCGIQRVSLMNLGEKLGEPQACVQEKLLHHCGSRWVADVVYGKKCGFSCQNREQETKNMFIIQLIMTVRSVGGSVQHRITVFAWHFTRNK